MTLHEEDGTLENVAKQDNGKLILIRIGNFWGHAETIQVSEGYDVIIRVPFIRKTQAERFIEKIAS